MAAIGNGYGSEWHLLRWMGRHRNAFNARILETTGLAEGTIAWEDFRFSQNGNRALDEELQGLSFLPDEQLRAKWAEFWPARGRAQTWDAVGWLRGQGRQELLLVEAKANVRELASNCNAVEHGGRPQIRQALTQVKSALGVPDEKDWLTGYYQYANRVAALHFLTEQGVPAHLLFIYFVGDTGDSSRDCPDCKEAWSEALAMQEEHLGFPSGSPLKKRVHHLFLHVAGKPI